jgi:hypothetical protein
VFDGLNKLLERKEKKILFVGIGNLLKMDDGVGVYISSKIKNTGHISQQSILKRALRTISVK